MTIVPKKKQDHSSARSPWLMRLGVTLFGVGMLAVFAVFFMFATGLRDLPVWLSAVAGILTPLGLGLGLFSLIRENRQKTL